ncbi:MAG: cell division protein FtsZ, partial [Pseudomonadota bacterium]
APVIAEVARRKGVLTVGVVTKPFLFEGTRRMRAAEAGIAELQQHVDTLIVIPNQNLFLIASPDTTFKEAFQMADEVLQQGVRSITDLMVMPGLINLDFADVRSVMSEMGKAMMGTGEGEGENRAQEAAEQAIANPLLEGVSMQGAKGVIISIIGGEDMKLFEVDGAANHIRSLVDEDANIIWGSAFNPDLEGRIRVSVVATGIEQGEGELQPASLPAARTQARAPQRPVLDLMGENEAPEGSEGEADADPSAEAESSPQRTPLVFTPAPAPAPTPIPPPPAITLTPPDPLPGESDLSGDETDEESSEEDGYSPFGSDAGHSVPTEYEPEPEAEPEPEIELEAEFELDDEVSDTPQLSLDADRHDEEAPASPLIKPRALFSDPVAEAQDEDDDGYSDDARPFDLTGMQAGDEMGELEDEDVDEIVDPLAGLRGASGEPLDLSAADAPDPALTSRKQREENAVFSEIEDGEGSGNRGAGPTSKGSTDSGATESGATTLFERMANLSRGSSPDYGEDDEDDEDTTALSIPRFLGRQNNQ